MVVISIDQCDWILLYSVTNPVLVVLEPYLSGLLLLRDDRKIKENT